MSFFSKIGDFAKSALGAVTGFIGGDVGRLLGAGVSTAANIYGQRQANVATREMQEDAQSFNAEQAALGRAFNSDEARTARDFNASQAGLQRDWSAAQARAAWDWEANQAQQQMQFQERMASTQHQRAAADLSAAGFNPILTASSGFQAASPSGAAGGASAATSSAASANAASGPSASSGIGGRMENVLSGLLSSAYQMALVENVDAQTRKTQAETDVVRSDLVENADFLGSHPVPKTFSARESQMRSWRLSKESDRLVAAYDLTREEAKLVTEQVENAVEERRRIRADTRSKNADAVLRELDQAEARNRSRFHTENPDFSTYSNSLKSVGEALNSGLKLRGLFSR